MALRGGGASALRRAAGLCGRVDRVFGRGNGRWLRRGFAAQPPTGLSFTDITQPEQWYPKARLSKRRIIYHGGPTNSGKTYNALKALRAASPEGGGGVYAGPLRLLALEIFERMNNEGVYCSLFTGQERQVVPFATHASCTIEMVPLMRRFDVAVIDEIQMIGTPERGHAWTRAFHGLDAREIHLCGAMDAVPIVQKMCEVTGDEFHLQSYERLSPLQILPKPLGSWSDVQKGDCVVSFSRDDIHLSRKAIEKHTKLKCCVVYGQLPPETRANQAKVFNDVDSGYDVLVASDAIGMGLNLNIRRIIFKTTIKFHGKANVGDKNADLPEMRSVEPTLIKQISGRAGRFSTQYEEAGGGVSAFAHSDLEHILESMAKPEPKIMQAALFPPAEILQCFAHEIGEPNMPLQELIPKFVEMAQFDSKSYFLGGHYDQAKAATKLESVPLDLADMLTFSTAPCNLNDRFIVSMYTKYAECRVKGATTEANVLLPLRAPRRVLELHDLCSRHNALDLYLWLAFRFPETFPGSEGALVQKAKCIEMVAEALSKDLELPPQRGPATGPPMAPQRAGPPLTQPRTFQRTGGPAAASPRPSASAPARRKAFSSAPVTNFAQRAPVHVISQQKAPVKVKPFVPDAKPPRKAKAKT
ncbi:P-loop containing nucleoside triphosphate hydrolase protein [Pelagophyceae sp. CCMP2097]|nr:P-loop containing nucleoside triphosphate hydrolase protein [Pelagophyceae sp. CCMP2097]